MQIGIVGKPNVGKSTFFSASTLATVPIANYPFTTVEPNKGVGYARIKCVCEEFGVEDNPVNSICINGIRLVPVELVDCAGLVPGAWMGRGLGNRFLDEIRRADALLHIVDASGGTDIEGRPCEPGAHDPLEDIEFLDRELAMWVVQIIKRDWGKVSRRAEMSGEDLASLLETRLSGLAITRHHIVSALKKSDLAGVGPTSWTDEQLASFTHHLIKISKPMVIVANKIDMPESKENYEKIVDAGYRVVPCCAEAELALRRAAERKLINYIPGDSDFELLKPEELTSQQKKALELIRERVLSKYRSTGVVEAINTAVFELLQMIAVYPVEDPVKLCDHEGRVLPDVYLVPKGTTARQLAYRIHTELGETFIHAIDARTKMRLSEDYQLRDRDVITIVSAKKRG